MMRALVFLATLLLAGCASMMKPPDITLAGVDLESLGLFEQRFILKLRVTNPNNMDIPVEGLSFDVDLNGKPFAKGVSGVAVTIPAMGETLLNVKASSNLAAFLRQWQDFRKDGRLGLDYRVKGNVRVTGRGAIPFDKKGDVPIPRLPGLDEPGPRPNPNAI